MLRYSRNGVRQICHYARTFSRRTAKAIDPPAREGREIEHSSELDRPCSSNLADQPVTSHDEVCSDALGASTSSLPQYAPLTNIYYLPILQCLMRITLINLIYSCVFLIFATAIPVDNLKSALHFNKRYDSISPDTDQMAAKEAVEGAGNSQIGSPQGT